MERIPIRAGVVGGGSAGNLRNGIFQFMVMSYEDRRRREVELALNNPHLPGFDIFIVSQLPLELQGAELGRRSEQHRRREEQRQFWIRQTEAMNRQFEEIMSHQRSTLEHLARLVCPPPRFRLLSSVRSADLRFTAGAQNVNSGPAEVITIDDNDADDVTETGNSNEVLIPQKQATQKCPFCSKNLSTGHMSRHVHLHCKSARKEMNSRQDWDCMRHKRK